MATKTLKILGLLLTYPNKNLVQAAGDISKALETEQWLPKKYLAGVQKLLAHLRSSDLIDLQE